MKNIITIFTCVLMLCSSCADFLEEEPRSEISASQYFTSPEHARATVNRLYRVGALSFYEGSDFLGGRAIMYEGYISGFFSDKILKGQRPIAQYAPVLKHTSENISAELDGVWNNGYQAIARSNVAIKAIPSTPGLSDKERNQLMAKAKFFRAYNYFFLVKFFGDIPLIVEPYESLNNLYVSRTPAADVYRQIEQDLKDAMAGELENKTFVDNGFEITQAIVETTLARVYMQMSGYPLKEVRYSDAAKLARSIISAGKHRLIPHGDTPETSAYNIMRTSDLETEYIFSKEYVDGIANGGLTNFAFPVAAGQLGIFKIPSTSNAYEPDESIINAYDPKLDLRVQEKQYFFRRYTYTKDGEEQTIDFGEYCNWMYYDEKAMLVTGRSEKDIPIYRYPEVLLIAAEAIAQSEGVTAEAVGYIADVRARAYTTVSKDKIVSELSKLSKDEFTKEVWNERLREFPLEFMIWNDIQRTRMYPVTSSNTPGTISYVPVIGATNPQEATYQEKDLLWPISKNEMQRNPALVQNPGF